MALFEFVGALAEVSVWVPRVTSHTNCLISSLRNTFIFIVVRLALAGYENNCIHFICKTLLLI